MCAVQQTVELIQESDPVIVLDLNARVDMCQITTLRPTSIHPLGPRKNERGGHRVEG